LSLRFKGQLSTRTNSRTSNNHFFNVFTSDWHTRRTKTGLHMQPHTTSYQQHTLYHKTVYNIM